MDVAFYEVFEEEKRALKQFLPAGIKAAFYSQTTQEKTGSAPPAPFISIRTHSKIPVHWSPHLKAVLTRSQGFDHLVTFRKAAGFEGSLGHLSNYCARAVAEHVLMSLMALWRKLDAQQNQFRSFKRDGLTGRQLADKKACVIGIGNIGSEIVELLKSVRMKVKGVDILKRSKRLEYVTLKEGVKWADVLVIAAALTPKTKRLLTYNILKDVKPGCTLINIARGEIAPIQDLKKLLEKGVLGAIALDIYEGEAELAGALRKGKRSATPAVQAVLALKGRENVLLTPHNAFNTKEALEEKARRSVEGIQAFLKQGKFPHEVPIDNLVA